MNLYMSEWIKGFISGVFATAFGFGLTMLWDLYQSRKREKAILFAVSSDIYENIEVLKNNQSILEEELEILNKNKMIVNPLDLLRSGFWDLLKINLPFTHVRNQKLLLKIIEVAQLTNSVNETIRSRENYRIHNQAMTDYTFRMKSYDEILLKDIKTLLKQFKDLTEMEIKKQITYLKKQ
jgi:hypothetical protein